MPEKPSTVRVALKWGAISGIASVVFSLILFLTDQIGNQALSVVPLVFAITFIVLAMREFRTLNEGYLSFGEGFGVGTLVSAIAGLISATFTTIYTSFVDTTFYERLADKTQEQWEKQGLSDTQIEQASEMTKMFQSPGLLFAIGLLGAVIFGVILSLIIAAIMQRKRPVFE